MEELGLLSDEVPGDGNPREQHSRKKLKEDHMYSGYFPIDTKGQDMFYALFESRADGIRDTEEDPLLIWLRGSPGCSASAQIFSETGPYKIDMETRFGKPELNLNKHSWNNFTNVMYLDAPVGTGYSFRRGSDKGKRDYNIDQVVQDFVNFMKMFYDKHEAFRGREMYLVAQDFTAGNYLPAFAAAIQDVRDSKADLKDEAFEEMFLAESEKEWDAWFGLSGIFMISPEVDGSIQRHDTRNYAEKVELISSVEVPLMSFTSDWCREAIESGKYWYELLACGINESFATGNPIYPTFDIRNFKKQCMNWFTCKKNDQLQSISMNQLQVLDALEANTQSEHWHTWSWSDCDIWAGYKIRSKFNDTSENYPQLKFTSGAVNLIADILERKQVKVFILNGDLDFKINWMGTDLLAKSFTWYGQKDFTESEPHDFKWTDMRNGREHMGGEMLIKDKFTFLKAFNTGLDVHDEKPEMLYDVLKRWISNSEGQVIDL